MIPLVNEKYHYILFYTPKAACTYLRQLFLNLHADELGAKERGRLNSILDLEKVFPFDRSKNYDSYFKFVLVRHPLTRFVSAYLNRITGEQKECHPQIERYFKNKYGEDYPVSYSFNQTLECFINSPYNYMENVHFLPQHDTLTMGRQYDVKTEYCTRSNNVIQRFKNLFRRNLYIDRVCKMESLRTDIESAYSHIFTDAPEKMQMVSEYLESSPMNNVSLTDDAEILNAGDLSHDEIYNLKRKPNYASFLNEEICSTLAARYESDFKLFNYNEDISSVLNFEKNKNQHLISLIPPDFDAQAYLDLNSDLGEHGLTSEQDAILHWVQYGHMENRNYKRKV